VKQKNMTQPGSPGALERLQRRFALRQEKMTLGSQTLWLPELADPQSYIEERLSASAGVKMELPYWTRLWPASLILARFVLTLPPQDDPLLELGAGLGVPGLLAARRGWRVYLTDLDPDALEFARAAVEINELDHLVEVRPLDWTLPPDPLGPFSTVIGAEILYHPPLYPQLRDLLAHLLQPQGSVFISHEERPFPITFFDLARERFTVKTTSQTLRSLDDKKQTSRVYLYALKHLPST
jgi:predicted nicotinamide N-methyase